MQDREYQSAIAVSFSDRALTIDFTRHKDAVLQLEFGSSIVPLRFCFDSIRLNQEFNAIRGLHSSSSKSSSQSMELRRNQSFWH